jgi:hypothetical protein
MSFQWIIDRAESISIENKRIAASSITRSGIVRAVSRGNPTWKFTVKLPDGIPWQEIRGYIADSAYYGTVTSRTIQFNTSGQASWLSKYQGNSVNYTGFVCSFSTGATALTLTTSPTTSSGYRFRAGDWIQLGSSGKVYEVREDVAFNQNNVPLNRPIIDTTASGVSLRVGPNCVFTVICTQFPSYNLFARDQVSWDSSFIFNEVMP